MIDVITDRGRTVSVEELNTTKLLSHAAKQAKQRNYDDMLIVDVDAHHFEQEHMSEILPFLENDVHRQLLTASTLRGNNRSAVPHSIGYQDLGGRVTRYPLRATERTEFQDPARRDVELGYRWMDAMGVDYSCLFPTGMLVIGLHPQPEMEADLCWAYNRWLTEKVLPESNGRFYTMITLPFADPAEALRQVEVFGDRPGVKGVMITSVRNSAVHENRYMKLYRALEERGLSIAFHAGPNWDEALFKTCNRFIAVHALGFSWYNILHCTNWVLNALPERFPNLPVIWVESGLAWVPFLMQRLDNEYAMRSSECPGMKRKPSEYMREMFYSSQPMEVTDMGALETTFRMINAETQLLWSSDYPHWDFDLPSVIYDLPFLTDEARHNILGGNAARLFKLPPRNEKQKQNLIKLGNHTAA